MLAMMLMMLMMLVMMMMMMMMILVTTSLVVVMMVVVVVRFLTRMSMHLTMLQVTMLMKCHDLLLLKQNWMLLIWP